MKKSYSTYFLIFFVFLLTINALGGGWGLIADPSGKNLGFSIEMLKHSPFSNFLIPGLFLLIVLGIVPAIIFWGLIKKPKSNLVEKINFHKKYHWSWSFSFYIGIVLLLWLAIQILMIRQLEMLHFISVLVGVLIIVLANLQSTKQDYLKK